MASEYKIALCILHYGEPALTQRLHQQLLQAELGNAGVNVGATATTATNFQGSTYAKASHVYVLDNAAPKAYEHAWQRLKQNIYWPGALNYALLAFKEMGYTHLWFFNNDAYFTSKAPYLGRSSGRLAQMEKLLGRVGIYAPSVPLNPYHPQMVVNPAAQCRVVNYVDGIAPLLNLDCVSSIGGLDVGANIYGYGVDIWLGLRAKQAGWGVLVDHQVCVKHIYHSTAKKVDGFLAQAAQAERDYLTQRLGPNYMNIIKIQQEQWQDIPSL